VPIVDAKTGQSSLWIGGSANRNRDAFEQRFNDLVEAIEKELRTLPINASRERTASIAGD